MKQFIVYFAMSLIFAIAALVHVVFLTLYIAAASGKKDWKNVYSIMHLIMCVVYVVLTILMYHFGSMHLVGEIKPLIKSIMQ